jgi:hypothetical protein
MEQHDPFRPKAYRQTEQLNTGSQWESFGWSFSYERKGREGISSYNNAASNPGHCHCAPRSMLFSHGLSPMSASAALQLPRQDVWPGLALTHGDMLYRHIQDSLRTEDPTPQLILKGHIGQEHGLWFWIRLQAWLACVSTSPRQPFRQLPISRADHAPTTYSYRYGRGHVASAGELLRYQVQQNNNQSESTWDANASAISRCRRDR